MNDKATEKHHWPGPGTTREQGKWCLGASSEHIIAHRNLLQGPLGRRAVLLLYLSPCQALFGYSFSRSREAKELPEKHGELELPKSCSLSRLRVASVMSPGQGRSLKSGRKNLVARLIANWDSSASRPVSL